MKTSIPIVKRALLILILLFGASDLGFTQVITPSLDPTEPVIMPSATGWREQASAGVGYHEKSGTREQEKTLLYDYNVAGYSADLAFHFGNLYMEGHYGATTYSTKQDISSDYGQVPLKRSDARGSFVLSGDNFVTIGLGVHSQELEDYYTFQDPSDTPVKRSRLGTLGSISVILGEHFAIGAGVERVKESSNYLVNNNWTEFTGAVGIRSGSSGKIRFRLEYSFTNSPKATKSANGDLQANTHNKRTIQRGYGEIMFTGLLFSVKTQTDTIFEENDEEVKESKAQAGVLWIPPGGLALGFYFTTETSTGTYDDTFNEFSIRAGYVFN